MVTGADGPSMAVAKLSAGLATPLIALGVGLAAREIECDASKYWGIGSAIRCWVKLDPAPSALRPAARPMLHFGMCEYAETKEDAADAGESGREVIPSLALFSGVGTTVTIGASMAECGRIGGEESMVGLEGRVRGIVRFKCRV